MAIQRIATGGTAGGATDQEVVRDTIAAALVAGSNITITPNDGANTITIASTGGGGSTDPEIVRDTIATALVAGSNVTITPNDGADTITISSTGGGSTDPEVVRDTMAAALVAGSNVTITPNDGADTITIAATGGGGSSTILANTQTASYTLALSDANKAVVMDSPAGTFVTVPPNSSVNFPVGNVSEVVRAGTGMVTIVPGSGVTVTSPTNAQPVPQTQYSTARLWQRTTNDWIVSGDLQEEAQGSAFLFEESFATGNFTQWNSCQWTGRNDDCSTYNGTADYSATVVAIDGRPHVARFEVRDGDVPPFGGGERAEIAAPGLSDFDDLHARPGDERWIAFDMKLDAAFPNPGGWGGVLWQWHQSSSSEGSPALVINISPSGELSVGNNDPSAPSSTSLGQAVKGVWRRYVVHAKFSDNPAVGFREVWIDGERATPKVFCATLRPSETYCYMKLGHYRDNPSTGTAIVYFDNISVSARGPALATRWTGVDNSRYRSSTNLPSFSSDLTVLCWVRPETGAFSDASVIWAFEDGTYNQWFLLGGTSVILQASGANVGSHTPTANTWYKYAVIKSGTTGSLYVGGIGSALTLNASGSINQVTNGIANFYVAGSPSGTQSFNGRIANMKVYTAALTPSECETELAQYEPVRTANLLRRHPFNEKNTLDFSGSGATFTVLGTAPTMEEGPPIII